MKQETLKCSACGENRGEYFKYDPVTRTTYCVTCRNKTIVQNSVDDVDKLMEAIKQNGLDNSEGYAKLAAMCQEQIDKTGETILKLETVIGFVGDVREELKELRNEVKSQGEEIKSYGQKIDRQGAKIDKLLSKSEQEVENLRAQLRAAMSEKYISGEKVKDFAKELLKKSADDFLANFCEVVYSDDPQRLNAFLDSIDSGNDIADVELIIEFVINDLKKKNVTSLEYLVKRFNLQAKYQSRIEDVAKEVAHGIYNPILTRKVFVAFSGHDERKAVEIVNYMEEQGLDCYFSLRNLRHGKDAKEVYWETLHKALKHCQCLVFLSSDNSRDADCDALTELEYVSSELNKSANMGIAMYEYLLDDYSTKTPKLIKNTLKEYFENRSYYTDIDSLCQAIFKFIQSKKLQTLNGVTAKNVAAENDIVTNDETAAEIAVEEKPAKVAAKQEELKEKAATVSKAKSASKTTSVSVDTSAQKVKATKPTAATKLTASTKTKTAAKPILFDFDPSEFEIVGVELKRYIGNKENVVIPNGVLKICEEAFLGNSSITSVEIPSSVEMIGFSAFANCKNLNKIVIPSSVVVIDFYAFSGCTNLTFYCEAKSRPSGWEETWNAANRPVIWDYNSKSTEAEVSKTVKSEQPVSENAATNRNTIASKVTLENYDKNEFEIVGTELKNYKGEEEKVVIPYGVTSIGGWAFKKCRSMTSIEIPSSVTSIGKYAFYECSSLTSIEIPSSVTSIGECAFYGCSSLTSINIPSGVTSIGVCAFDGCSSLTIKCEAKSRPSGWKATWNSDKRPVKWDSKNQREKPIQKNNSEKNNSALIKYDKNEFEIVGTELKKYRGNKADVIIPDVVTSIGDKAFYECSSVTNIKIPSSVISIGEGAFSWCRSLISIEIPSSVTSIGDRAFSYCSSMTIINIPSGVTSIGDSTFYLCSSMTSVDIPSGVTSIGEWAFSWCRSLKSIVIPSSVKSIGNWTFSRCSSLTSIEIPSSVTNIGKVAFSRCSSLKSIVIPSSVTSIGNEAFSRCSRLTSIDIPSSVTSIGEWAFESCRSLTTINFGGTKETWKKINNKSKWKKIGRTVYCSDGKIKCLF